MIEFTNSGFIFRLEQNTIANSDCTLYQYDKDYNLIRKKHISINKLADFLLTI